MVHRLWSNASDMECDSLEGLIPPGTPPNMSDKGVKNER